MLGGIVTVNIFSSAGPVYYGRLNPAPDLYAGHMDLIRSLSASARLEALVLHDSLWAGYAGAGFALAAWWLGGLIAKKYGTEQSSS